jgi:hypothetical protein
MDLKFENVIKEMMFKYNLLEHQGDEAEDQKLKIQFGDILKQNGIQDDSLVQKIVDETFNAVQLHLKKTMGVD